MVNEDQKNGGGPRQGRDQCEGQCSPELPERTGLRSMLMG